MSATFVPGFLNEANCESRNFSESIEWKLSKIILVALLPYIYLKATTLLPPIQT